VGLFFYDIFWVFGTNVMVTVAKGIDAPVKLLFPKGELFSGQFSMLGLGDIVIPGLFVALMLRFDAKRHELAAAATPSSSSSSSSSSTPSTKRPYYKTVLASYAGGLIATLSVMHFFQAAQPALLYLVPACIISSLACAAVHKELKMLFAYSEEEKKEEVWKLFSLFLIISYYFFPTIRKRKLSDFNLK